MIGPGNPRRAWRSTPSLSLDVYRMYAFVMTISAPNRCAISAGGIRTLFGFTTGIRAGVRTGPWRVSSTPNRASPSRSTTSNTAGHPDLLIIGFA